MLQTRDFEKDVYDPSKFERYQAEALVHRHLPMTALTGILCHGDAQKAALQAVVDQRGQTLQVAAKPGYFF